MDKKHVIYKVIDDVLVRPFQYDLILLLRYESFD